MNKADVYIVWEDGNDSRFFGIDEVSLKRGTPKRHRSDKVGFMWDSKGRLSHNPGRLFAERREFVHAARQTCSACHFACHWRIFSLSVGDGAPKILLALVSMGDSLDGGSQI